jgi:hypothetical protein
MEQAFTALVLLPRPDEVRLPAAGHGRIFHPRFVYRTTIEEMI